jgi:hypothetical protein
VDDLIESGTIAPCRTAIKDAGVAVSAIDDGSWAFAYRMPVERSKSFFGKELAQRRQPLTKPPWPGAMILAVGDRNLTCCCSNVMLLSLALRPWGGVFN